MQLESLPTPTRFTYRTLTRFQRLLGLLLVLSVVATQPVLAQASNPLCSPNSASLVQMIEGFLIITTALGVMGLLIVWQLDALLEMVAIDRDQVANVKRHRGTATRSAGILLVSGPLFAIAGTTMGLPIAACIDLIPF